MAGNAYYDSAYSGKQVDEAIGRILSGELKGLTDRAAQSASAAAKSAKDAAGSAEAARQYSGKPPIIQGGHWWTWNAASQRYEDTGEAARGNLMYATFFLDPATGDLYMLTDSEYTGPEFRLANGNLEVVLNYGG